MHQIPVDPHLMQFIQQQITSGRFATPDAVVTEGLRLLQLQEGRLLALQSHIAEGITQLDQGQFLTPEELEKEMMYWDEEE